MNASDCTTALAQWMCDARVRRLPYRNLPAELKPASLREAYAAQEAYYRLAKPVYGAVCGAKIATTTRRVGLARVPAAVRTASAARPWDRRCCAGDNRLPIRHSLART